MTNILFVCSRNQWRSPTGETLWRRHSFIHSRSAGTSPKAKHTINASDIKWADYIFVMEKKHHQRIKANFNRLLEYKAVHILDIPDDYQYMDKELQVILNQSVSAILSIEELPLS